MPDRQDRLPGAPRRVVWRVVAMGLLGHLACGAVALGFVLLGWGGGRGAILFLTGVLPWVLAASFGADWSCKQGFAEGVKRAPNAEALTA